MPETNQLIIVDTTPLIALAMIEQFDLGQSQSIRIQAGPISKLLSRPEGTRQTGRSAVFGDLSRVVERLSKVSIPVSLFGTALLAEIYGQLIDNGIRLNPMIVTQVLMLAGE